MRKVSFRGFARKFARDLVANPSLSFWISNRDLWKIIENRRKFRKMQIQFCWAQWVKIYILYKACIGVWAINFELLIQIQFEYFCHSLKSTDVFELNFEYVSSKAMVDILWNFCTKLLSRSIVMPVFLFMLFSASSFCVAFYIKFLWLKFLPLPSDAKIDLWWFIHKLFTSLDRVSKLGLNKVFKTQFES